MIDTGIDTGFVGDPFFDSATGQVGAIRHTDELGYWVEYWDRATAKSVRKHPLPKSTVEVTLAAEGRRALTLDTDRRPRVFDLPSGQEVFRLDPMPGIISIGISRDGRTFVISDQRDRWVFRLPEIGVKVGVAVPDAKPVDLRGPGPKVGQVVRDEMTLKMTDGTFSVTAGGVTETGKMTMTGDGVYEEAVLAVGGGEITKSRTKVVREKITESITFEGETDTHDDTSSLEGETVEFEKAGAEWKRSLVGKVPTDEQKRDLTFFPPPLPAAEFYPAAPVKPGHSWNPDVTKLTRHLGLPMPVQIEGGTWKMTFVRVTTVNGEECAEIAEEVDVRAKVKGEKDAGTIAVKVRGTTYRSLKTSVCVESRFAGTMSATETQTVEGQAVRIAIGGSIEVHFKSRLK